MSHLPIRYNTQVSKSSRRAPYRGAFYFLPPLPDFSVKTEGLLKIVEGGEGLDDIGVVDCR